MNSKERVISTLNKEAVDRVPLDCWVYQKKLVEIINDALLLDGEEEDTKGFIVKLILKGIN